MIKKVLIANRGEIAIRIIRACRELGITSVAVYSDADKNNLHALLADESIKIGPGPATESYLKMDTILTAASISGADAIHPGFGFLSENAKFAGLVKDCEITWIGPNQEVITNLGDKAKAREIMEKAGVPIIPGSPILKDLDDAKTWAKTIGFPIMLKAVSGGGGRGIRMLDAMQELEDVFTTASQEALSAFGDGSLYMEKRIVTARHIEFQILADEQGNVVHLGERDCSLQRRNQKVLEEAPSIGLSKDLRDRMGASAVAAAKASKYTNAGTIEFLLEPDGNYYFMEMNTRIQVEHPITEMITGVDIVKEQLMISSGKKLSVKQADIKISGHAIECRINAENPAKNFMPSTAPITKLALPGGFGVRFDGSVYQGFGISPYYDSMLGKLIVRGEDRAEAIAKMKSALYELIVEGPVINKDFQMAILNNPDYVKGEFNTKFIEQNIDKLI